MKVYQLLTIVMFASASTLVAQNPAATKPPVGVPADATFFQGKWYRVYLGGLRWTNAKAKCATLRGRLAAVPDEPTHAFIRELAEQRNLWLGATDEKKEMQWLWADGTEMSFKAWDSGQPDNYKKRSYVYIRSNGRWHDTVDDDSGVVGYICEWNAR
jgi:hypothetical protein